MERGNGMARPSPRLDATEGGDLVGAGGVLQLVAVTVDSCSFAYLSCISFRFNISPQQPLRHSYYNVEVTCIVWRKGSPGRFSATSRRIKQDFFPMFYFIQSFTRSHLHSFSRLYSKSNGLHFLHENQDLGRVQVYNWDMLALIARRWVGCHFDD